MARKLATKRNEPDFRRNLGVMEMVDALLVFFGLHWLRHHVRRHDFLFGANVCIAHRDAREGASVPTAAAATARAIVRRRFKSGRLVLVEAVVLVVVIVVVLVLRILPVAGLGISIGLVRRRIIAEASQLPRSAPTVRASKESSTSSHSCGVIGASSCFFLRLKRSKNFRTRDFGISTYPGPRMPLSR